MELTDYLRILRRRLALVLSCLLAGAIIGLGAAFVLPKSYTSSSRILFGATGGKTIDEVSQGAEYAASQMSSFAEVARSPIVLEPVIAELHLDETPEDLAKTVTVDVPAQTVVLEIQVEREDPHEAADIANAISQHVMTQVTDLSPDDDNGKPILKASVIAQASPADDPTFPSKRVFLPVGAFAGLLLGLAAAILLELGATDRPRTRPRGRRPTRPEPDVHHPA